MERSAATTQQDNQSACSTSMLLAGKWHDGAALWAWTHTQPYAYSCIRGKYICLWGEMYYVNRMKTWKNVPERGGWWDKLTTSRGRKASSCRRTSSPTAPPMDVALSKDTTSSWVRPFRSTPFTWTGDICIRCGLKHWSNSNLYQYFNISIIINIWKLITTTDAYSHWTWKFLVHTHNQQQCRRHTSVSPWRYMLTWSSCISFSIITMWFIIF